MNMKVDAQIKKAYRLALNVRKKAHAPYSKFLVGSCLIAKNGKTFTGCNVENASYGGTVCAERVAIFKAVSEGVSDFTDVIVVTGSQNPAFPCAFCLQVMAEFLNPETTIWIANLKGMKAKYRFDDLLPHPFNPKSLQIK